MTRIAFIMLCHKDPERIIDLAGLLVARGDCLALHVDARMPPGQYARIEAALGGNPSIRLVRRVRCGWGEWSLVEASLRGLRLAVRSFPDATHFYLLSGDCQPIKSRETICAHLGRASVDYIEGNDFFESDWIKTGLKAERLHYRHFFNQRERPRLFDASLAVQQRLGLARPVPQGIRVMIGSQWFCIRRSTAVAILDFLRVRPELIRFFRTTWIPDETFFQTLVYHLVPPEEIVSRPPTFLIFSDYGIPVVFHDDHSDLLRSQPHFFARKLSPNARTLMLEMRRQFLSGEEQPVPAIAGGAKLYHFIAGKGRFGRRFAPRFWETGSTIGREREVLLITCKKWHVGRRIADLIAGNQGPRSVGYAFDEVEADRSFLGQKGAGLVKRLRHRRAFLRTLFDVSGESRLTLCLDPATIEPIRDLAADRCNLRLLEVGCEFSDDYLIEHAERIGLYSRGMGEQMLSDLLATLRRSIRDESVELRELGLDFHFRLLQSAPEETNAYQLAQFLQVPVERCREIAAREDLFA